MINVYIMGVDNMIFNVIPLHYCNQERFDGVVKLWLGNTNSRTSKRLAGLVGGNKTPLEHNFEERTGRTTA